MITINKRQKLVQSAFLKNEKAVIRRLEQVYGQSLKDITGKVESLEFSIGKLKQKYDWMDSDDPERAKIKSQIQSKIYQKQYQEQLQVQVEGILKQMQTRSFATVSEYLDECYTDGFIGTIFDAHGQNVPFMAPINQESMVRAVQLDSKISKGLYTRLGEDVGMLKKKITAQVSRSIATGMTFAETAKQLEMQSRIGYNNAIRIARTEGGRIRNQAAYDAALKAKEEGADIVLQWDATLDKRTRSSHIHMDGEIVELGERFSNGLLFPCDPNGSAAEVINCRCAALQRARWALDDGAFTKFNGFTGQIETFDSPQDYDEFKKAYMSKENRQYMDYVEQMQRKYGTKDFAKVLDSMSESEYKHYSGLLGENPIYNQKSSKKSLTNTSNRVKMNLQFFASKEKQFGKKVGKHARAFGLDPSKKEDRDKFQLIIDDIMATAEEVRIGEWRGQSEDVLFHIKGKDVVLTKQDGEFITILEGGIDNARVKNARNK